jgi:phospholipase A1
MIISGANLQSMNRIKGQSVFHLLVSIFLLIQADTFGQGKSNQFFEDEAQSLSERWELDSANRKGTFRIVYYKPVYVLLGNWTSNPNVQPYSENPDYTVNQPIPLDPWELKFQLSFKTKVWQGIFGKHGDLWVGYTQSSRWQLYNAELSRAFRETNYEPEAMLTFATRYKVLGFEGRLLGVGFAHQSNGRALPLSRSWNRIIFQAGFEKENWIVLFRPWIRIPDEDDENPEITNFTGRGDLLVSHNWRNHQFSLIGRHSLQFGDNSRGSLQFDWAIPIKGHLKGHLQIFHGYGESMIDYNHKQTTIGLGVSLVEWQ